jgi:hypothetical protein
MDTFIFLTGITALTVILSGVAFVGGWLLTEVSKPVLNVKPFNCRPCLTFWLTAAFNAAFAFAAAPYLVDGGLVTEGLTATYGIAGVGVLLGLIGFFYLKSKFRTYD